VFPAIPPYFILRDGGLQYRWNATSLNIACKPTNKCEIITRIKISACAGMTKCNEKFVFFFGGK